MADKKWFTGKYRRSLLDMHIESWDERFLAQFDAARYVELLKTAGVQSAMVYANSHVGCCYWPSRTGEMHKGLKGKDIFGETLDLCHRAGMDFIAYYSIIYNNRAYESNASWRLVSSDGRASREKKTESLITGRYGVCCPNTRYRDFAISQIEELCGSYEFEGIFFDMAFWPGVCYCAACRERFKKETGDDLPLIVNWMDSKWKRFQSKREEWMEEFVRTIKNSVIKIKPNITVLFNSSPPVTFPWFAGSSQGVLDQCDYLGGDFYGGYLDQSFLCKLFSNLSKNMPFEYYTSRCQSNLDEHVASKSEEALKLHNYLALAHNGAFLFIDAVDPAGTVNPEVYSLMGRIFKESEKLEPHLGGEMLRDVAIYYSIDSRMSFEDDGSDASVISMKMPHLDAVLGAAGTLRDNHIPFTVIGKKNLDGLHSYKILILPDVLFLDENEAAAVREFVESGGSLYASGHTSPDCLGDVLGLEYEGEFKEKVCYIAPVNEGYALLPHINLQYPLSIRKYQMKAKPKNTEEVAAEIILPYTRSYSVDKFAAIHSNPPGETTGYPGIICRNYGKGKVVWSASPLEAIRQIPHTEIFSGIARYLAPEGFSFEAEAPAPIEIIVFQQRDRKRFIIHILNEQDKMPPLKVHDIKVRVKTGGSLAHKAVNLPDGSDVLFMQKGEHTVVFVQEVEIYRMIALYYE